MSPATDLAKTAGLVNKMEAAAVEVCDGLAAVD